MFQNSRSSEFIEWKQPDRTEQNRFREQTDGCRGGGREGEKRVREMKRYKLSAAK